ncbi:hypothetical protein L596_004361 [Steinernema carpocapsae]|uniref:Uncharacterized protein n=1 Tax=Steinernema carpocapsae TaxID=34508 RepID=A0A4U8UVN6_STECR|nr:hypothetical protein L596_004361 [Steinernema carpocapsae]
MSETADQVPARGLGRTIRRRVLHSKDPVHARHGKGRPDRPVRACPVPASSRLRNHHQQVAGTDATPRGLCFQGRQVWSHGQLYTAFSRVRNMASIKVLNTGSTHPGHIRNVVYHELLR